jgi:hypothetical protein
LATWILFLFANPLAEACGDKLLSIARGIRLQHAYKARYPASILLYVRRPAGNTPTDRERAYLVQMGLLYMSLRQAGHKPQAVGTTAELDQTLKTGRFDFVLVDPTDASGIIERVSPTPSKPTVLPVMYKPSKADFANAQKQFVFVLKTPATSTQHLEAIDQAMKSRMRAGAAAIS